MECNIITDNLTQLVYKKDSEYRLDRVIYGICPITEEEEKLLDKGETIFKDVGNSIYYQLSNRNCIGYGELDFENEDDLELLEKVNPFDSSCVGGFIPRLFNYEKGTGECDNHGIRYIETFDIIKLFKYAHCRINKAKLCAIYKIKSINICKNMKPNLTQ